MSTSVPNSDQKQTTSGNNSTLNSSLAGGCAVCGKADKLLRCSRCKGINYCTKEHQKMDWKRHKKHCYSLSVTNTLHAVEAGSQDLQQQAQASSVQSKNKSPAKNFVKGSDDKVDSKKLENDENQNAKSYRSDIKDSLHTKEPRDDWTSPITYEGSSEDTILGARSELLNPLQGSKILNRSDNKPAVEMSVLHHNHMKNYPEVCLKQDDNLSPSLLPWYKKNLEEINDICQNVIRDMNKWGVCVIDNFLGSERGLAVLDEVLSTYSSGVFRDGQLVKASTIDMKTIRSDQITWLDGKEKNCKNIRVLISKVDTIIMRANKMPNNGKLGDYTINGRTKAMVACYPGSGTHYVKHVDNPNRDGRCITAIYYLNRDWDIKQNGGLLRIFPEGLEDQVADIEPIFDRMIFFWSDRRNPHEVQPAYKMRYAVTLWYFDAEERNAACRRYQSDKETNPDPGNS